jgi:hypothetical protein
MLMDWLTNFQVNRQRDKGINGENDQIFGVVLPTSCDRCLWVKVVLAEIANFYWVLNKSAVNVKVRFVSNSFIK